MCTASSPYTPIPVLTRDSVRPLAQHYSEREHTVLSSTDKNRHLQQRGEEERAVTVLVTAVSGRRAQFRLRLSENLRNREPRPPLERRPEGSGHRRHLSHPAPPPATPPSPAAGEGARQASPASVARELPLPRAWPSLSVGKTSGRSPALTFGVCWGDKGEIPVAGRIERRLLRARGLHLPALRGGCGAGGGQQEASGHRGLWPRGWLLRQRPAPNSTAQPPHRATTTDTAPPIGCLQDEPWLAAVQPVLSGSPALSRAAKSFDFDIKLLLIGRGVTRRWEGRGRHATGAGAGAAVRPCLIFGPVAAVALWAASYPFSPFPFESGPAPLGLTLLPWAPLASALCAWRSEARGWPAGTGSVGYMNAPPQGRPGNALLSCCRQFFAWKAAWPDPANNEKQPLALRSLEDSHRGSWRSAGCSVWELLSPRWVSVKGVRLDGF